MFIKRNKKKFELIRNLKIDSKQATLGKIYKSKIYNMFYKNVGNQLYMNSNFDEKTIREKVKQIFIENIILDLIIFVSCIIIYGFNYYMIIIYFFLIIICMKLNIKSNLNKDNIKVLEQIPDLIIEIKSSYYENKMVLESLNEAIKCVPYEVSLKAMELYKILSSTNVKIEIEKYNREIKNDYLKILLNILYITKEYGETKKNGYSIFTMNLNYLLEEVNLEIQKQKLIKMKLKGLLFSALFPLAFINLIEKWSINNFEMLSSFYNSNVGFLIKNLVIFITLFSIILIMNIQSLDEEKINVNSDDDMIAKISKNKNFKKLINIVKPKNDTRTYNKMISLMYKAKEKNEINKIYVKKICCGILGLFLSIGMIIKANCYTNSISKIIIIIEPLLVILITFISYMFPNIIMLNRTKFIKTKVQAEVDRYNTLILLLMNYERVSVELILEYMERFSDKYKNEIKKCILNFEKSKEGALEEFKLETDNKVMKRLIRNLILCVRNIRVSEAFEALETEREFYKKSMEIANEKDISEKYNLAIIFGSVPYYALIILYFVFPIVYTSVVEMMGMIQEIKGI